MKQLPPGESENEAEMDLFDHIRELRRRLIYCILTIAAGTGLCYVCSGVIFDLLTSSFKEAFGQDALIGTGPAEAFMLKLKAAVFAGTILTSPVLFYQVWLFISPGLHEHERKLVFPFVGGSTFLFLLGALFCNEWVMPFAFEFFYGQYESIGVTPQIRISEHLSLMMQSIIGFGVVFELPMLAYFLARLRLIDDTTLTRWFRHAIVLIFLVSAFLTPPDVLTQFMMAIPLIGLYGFSILVVKWTYKTEEKQVTDDSGIKE